ncbi:hypothetical protein ACJX0J_022446 [Zea mays]
MNNMNSPHLISEDIQVTVKQLYNWDLECGLFTNTQYWSLYAFQHKIHGGFMDGQDNNMGLQEFCCSEAVRIDTATIYKNKIQNILTLFTEGMYRGSAEYSLRQHFFIYYIIC